MKRIDNNIRQWIKFIFLSAIGIFIFFVPIKLNGSSSIPLDHLVTLFRFSFPFVSKLMAMAFILTGAIHPFISGTWKTSLTNRVFSFFKILGVAVALLYWMPFTPEWLMRSDMLPFLFEKLVIPVGLIVPIGSIFLAFLVNFGLLEFFGVLMEPLMRPVWKTPGRSAIDAVASFVGSYSIALLITNRVFVDGGYTRKEATIIATGFSTVSATFMIIVARTLGLMGQWNFYFWSTLVITFLVTAITVRLYPLSHLEHNRKGKASRPNSRSDGRIRQAVRAALTACGKAPSLASVIRQNMVDGSLMTMSILPTILSVGLLGLILANYTPLFKWLGYVFYPLTQMLHFEEPLLTGQAAAIGITEMFLPALLTSQAVMQTKWIIGVTSVSSILFFSASIPCILSTQIPIRMLDLILIWFERTVLSIILAWLVFILFIG